MKFLFLTIFALTSQSAFSQQFSVSLSIADSIGLNQFNYVIEGSVILDDETVFHAELLDSTNTTVLVVGEHHMNGVQPSTLSNFSFNTETKIYHLEMGTFNTPKNVIHLWLTKNGTMSQELFYQE